MGNLKAHCKRDFEMFLLCILIKTLDTVTCNMRKQPDLMTTYLLWELVKWDIMFSWSNYLLFFAFTVVTRGFSALYTARRPRNFLGICDVISKCFASHLQLLKCWYSSTIVTRGLTAHCSTRLPEINLTFRRL